MTQSSALIGGTALSNATFWAGPRRQCSDRLDRRSCLNSCKAATRPVNSRHPLTTVWGKVADSGVIVAGRPRRRGRRRRRQRLLTRALPVAVLAVAAFAGGVLL